MFIMFMLIIMTTIISNIIAPIQNAYADYITKGSPIYYAGGLTHAYEVSGYDDVVCGHGMLDAHPSGYIAVQDPPVLGRWNEDITQTLKRMYTWILSSNGRTAISNVQSNLNKQYTGYTSESEAKQVLLHAIVSQEMSGNMGKVQNHWKGKNLGLYDLLMEYYNESKSYYYGDTSRVTVRWSSAYGSIQPMVLFDYNNAPPIQTYQIRLFISKTVNNVKDGTRTNGIKFYASASGQPDKTITLGSDGTSDIITYTTSSYTTPSPLTIQFTESTLDANARGLLPAGTITKTFSWNTSSSIEIVSIDNKETAKGAIKIIKKSSDPDAIKKYPKLFSLEGAKFEAKAEFGANKVYTAFTDSNGIAMFSELPVGTYTVTEVTAPAGHMKSYKTETIRVQGNKTLSYEFINTADFMEVEFNKYMTSFDINTLSPDWKPRIRLNETEAIKDLLPNVGRYSLDGTEFGLYDNKEGNGTPYLTFKINKDTVDKHNTLFLPDGRVGSKAKILFKIPSSLMNKELYIVETKFPNNVTAEFNNMLGRFTSAKVTFNGGMSDILNAWMENTPKIPPLPPLQKYDAITMDTRPMEGYTFEGAKFKLEYYKLNAVSPSTILILESDTNGTVDFTPFKEFKASDGTLHRYIIPDRGYHNDTFAKPGKYRITEIVAPEGYQKVDPIEFTWDGNTDFPVDKFKIYEKRALGDLIIYKYAYNTDIHGNIIEPRKEIPLKEAKFDLFPKSDIIYKGEEIKKNESIWVHAGVGPGQTGAGPAEKFYPGFKTNDEGKIILNDLPYGDYILREIKAPDGHKRITEDIQVSIRGNGTTSVVKAVENVPYLTNLKVIKEDSLTKEPITMSSMKFQILDTNKNVIDFRVPDTSDLTSNDSIIDPNTGTNDNWDDYLLEPVNNTKTKIVNTFVTDNQGAITLPEKLKDGTYYIKEIEPPHSYYISSNFEENLTEFTVKGEDTPDELVIVKIPNNRQYGRVIIDKHPFINNDPRNELDTSISLEGAEFELIAEENILHPATGEILYNKGDIVNNKFTFENNTYISELVPLGSYKIHEVKAPIGYLKSTKNYNPDTIVNITSSKENYTESIIDTYQSIGNVKNEIKIEKVDSADKNNKLSQAVFNLRVKENDKIIQEISLDPTSDTGITSLKEIHIPSNAIVELEEMSAPKNYTRDTNIYTFSLNDNQQLVAAQDFGKNIELYESDNGAIELIFKNNKIKHKPGIDITSVIINKIDSNNNPVKGALLAIRNKTTGEWVNIYNYLGSQYDQPDEEAQTVYINNINNLIKSVNVNTIEEYKQYISKYTPFMLQSNEFHTYLQPKNIITYPSLNQLNKQEYHNDLYGSIFKTFNINNIININTPSFPEYYFTTDNITQVSKYAWLSMGEPLQLIGLPVGEYELVELKEPFGFVAKNKNDNIQAFKINPLSKTLGALNISTVNMINHNISVNINKKDSIYKQPLKGAKLRIYYKPLYIATDNPIFNTGNDKIEKTYAVDLKTHLASKQLYESNIIGDGAVVDTIETNDDPIILKNLAYGSYYIEEVKAPSGYIKENNIWRFYITPTMLDDNNNMNIDIYNQPVQEIIMPETGVNEIITNIISGTLAIIIGTTGIIAARKQEKINKH